MMRGNAVRYLGWHIVDRAGPRLLACWVLIAAICLPLHFAMKNSNPSPEALGQMVASLHAQFVWISALIVFHGIVAEDRTRGYYRFYLAKPVSPVWFYAQSYLLGLAAMVLYSVGFVVLFSLAARPVWTWALTWNGLANGLLVGGLLFFFSTLWARDWLGMVVVLIGAALVRARWPAAGERGSTLGRVLNGVLPPTHLMNGHPTTAQWSWIAGWGFALLAGGLLVLRYRPLGED